MAIDEIDPAYANRSAICLPYCDGKRMHAVNYDWNVFRRGINSVILGEGFEEDRCIGYWFFTEDEMEAIEEYTQASIRAYNGDTSALQSLQYLPNPLVDKLFAYLRQDVCRTAPTKLFHEDCKSLSSMRRGMKYFNKPNKALIDVRDIIKLPDTAFAERRADEREDIEGEEL